ncbi:SDR family NAD(P)-dependent oxidoreductase [Streptomyces sp. NPDC059894]|uniref:SDR family NAD(P)-dependent oxidoreductase n=1 Tax=Streptomyces sp. NPDC059894 TaxID=3346991 RepID=UPI00364CD040
MSAHPVLLPAVVDGVPDQVVAVGSLRREQPELRTLLGAAGELFTRGVDITWDSVLPQVEAAAGLPAYAFQRRHYWLPGATRTGDVTAYGLDGADHPLLGALVDLPETDGVVFTSRIGPATHPWLADHLVHGAAVVPAAALIDLAVRAGDHVGLPTVAALTVHSPLVLPERGALRLRVSVGAPAQDGTRPIAVHSAGDQPTADGPGADWRRHVTGTLAPAAVPRTGGTGDEPWPPAGAQPMDVGTWHALLAGHGVEYGPAFQSLDAAWRHGGELFGHVGLDEQQLADHDRFGLHPALLEPAMRLAAPQDADGAPLPGTVRDVALHATAATALRVRLTPASDGTGAWTLLATDDAGNPVLTAGAVETRTVTPADLGRSAAGSGAVLLRVDWTELPDIAVPAGTAGPDGPEGHLRDAAALRALAAEVAAGARRPARLVAAAGGGTPLAATAEVLDLLQTWLAAPEFDDTPLVVVTHGATDSGDHDDHGDAGGSGGSGDSGGSGGSVDLAGAAVWGLVRAAQAENPGRITLLDLPAGQDGLPTDAALVTVLAADEPQVALRGETVRVPRLSRVAAGEPAETEPEAEGRTEAAPVFDPDGVVLVTGGTGSLGSLVARHLATVHGVRHLLLVGRQGPAAPGASELTAQLAESGTTVTVVAADVADADAVRALLTGLPDGRRLTGVVHTAGVLDDGVTGELTADRIATVFRPKVDALAHLDALTRELHPDLDVFAVFSSAAGVFGPAGQGNYAAANAVLDAVAATRRADGLPGLSLAWGLWQQDSGMTGTLTARDHSRIGRNGVLPLSPADGLALFDRALRSAPALVVPITLDLATARARAVADGGRVPPLLRGLLPGVRRRATATAEPAAATLAAQLADRPAEEQDRLLLDIVLTHVAVVLGHTGGDAIGAEQAFRDSGFDSLTAVELRNRLRDATGAALPSTAVFDHPTPLALARQLRVLLVGADDAQVSVSERALSQIEGLERLLTADEAEVDGVERLGLTTRLQELLARLTGGGAEDATGEAPDDDLDEASDQEMFRILGDEFGIQ